tara:strand:+ start:56 stop:190 length:135 start_codon:yes stop_codon:yes gene_type:complete
MTYLLLLLWWGMIWMVANESKGQHTPESAIILTVIALAPLPFIF